MMEKRTILAFGLSMALLIAYVWVQEQFFAPAPQAPRAGWPLLRPSKSTI